MSIFKFVLILIVGLVLYGNYEGEAKTIDLVNFRFRRSAGYRGLARVAGGKRDDDGVELKPENENEDEELFVTRENVCGHNYVWSILDGRCVSLNCLLGRDTGECPSFWDMSGSVLPKRARSSWTNSNKGGKGFSIGRALGK